MTEVTVQHASHRKVILASIIVACRKILLFFFNAFIRKKKDSPQVQIGTDSGALQSDIYR